MRTTWLVFSPSKTPFLAFTDNEVYASDAAFDNWVGLPFERQYVSKLTSWHTSDNNFSLSSYQNEQLVVDGLTVLGDFSSLNANAKYDNQPIPGPESKQLESRPTLTFEILKFLEYKLVSLHRLLLAELLLFPIVLFRLILASKLD